MVVTESELENNEVFSKIKALKLEPDEFLIIGSGIMFALGIRSLDDIHDIDIIVNEKGWEKVKNLSKVYTKYDFNDLHKRAYFVGKYPFLSPEDTIRYKKRMRRKKDFKHIQMIEKYLAKKY